LRDIYTLHETVLIVSLVIGNYVILDKIKENNTINCSIEQNRALKKKIKEIRHFRKFICFMIKIIP
jgi:hypothetical protein